MRAVVLLKAAGSSDGDLFRVLLSLQRSAFPDMQLYWSAAKRKVLLVPGDWHETEEVATALKELKEAARRHDATALEGESEATPPQGYEGADDWAYLDRKTGRPHPVDEDGNIRKSVVVVLSKGAAPNVRAAALAVAQARASTDVPTRAQTEAGNYRKGLVRLHGLSIRIENPKGSVRRGYDADGRPTWKVTMGADYGYFIRSHGSASTPYGRDGDPVDVFLGPRPDSELVFIVDQVNREGMFDEHKVVLGCASEEEARHTYLSCYSPGWTGLGAITRMHMDAFRTWLDSADKDKPVGTLFAPLHKGMVCIVVLKAITDEGREALRRRAKRQRREPKGNKGGGRFIVKIQGEKIHPEPKAEGVV